jgi:hypothetical protein
MRISLIKTQYGCATSFLPTISSAVHPVDPDKFKTMSLSILSRLERPPLDEFLASNILLR